MGVSTIITMTDFKYTTQIVARIILKNPSQIDKRVSVIVKAYKGTTGYTNSVFGHDYIGYWRFDNIFQTETTTAQLTTNGVIATSNTYFYPTTNDLWRDNTAW